jgi:hypothetical protein
MNYVIYVYYLIVICQYFFLFSYLTFHEVYYLNLSVIYSALSLKKKTHRKTKLVSKNAVNYHYRYFIGLWFSNLGIAVMIFGAKQI